MEKLKFTLFSVVILALIGIIGYWSFVSLQSGSEYVKDEKIKQLEKENEDLSKEVERLAGELSVLEVKVEESASTVEQGVEETPEPAVYKYQSLINELEKLVDGNIFLKEGSKGAHVGTVQSFLNIYNNTSNRMDNDYGAGTTKVVSAFQKDSGLSADGEAGVNTFKKMIDWLQKQS